MSPKLRAPRAAPSAWASSMPTPPTIRAISLATKMASARSPSAVSRRTSAPWGLWVSMRRGAPSMASATGRAAARISGVER